MALRDLVQGMSGEDVRALQQGLNEHFRGRRADLPPTGYFGTETLAALDAFQTENPGTGHADGTPDHVFGRASRLKLFPLAAVTVSVIGYRFGGLSPRSSAGIPYPNLGPGPLRLGDTPRPGLLLNPNANVLNVDWDSVMRPARLDFTPQRFPGLRLPLATPPMPLVPAPQLSTPSVTPPSSLNPLNIHHFELSPGSQTILTSPGQTSFTLSMQAVGVIGDNEGAHQEVATGAQLGSPNADGTGAWSVSWYAQITDVDRIGHLGRFHLWQPYAQFGAQTPIGSFRPVFTGNVAPINIGFDITDFLSINIAGVLAMTYDPATGTVQAGVQGTSGLVLKFGGPPTPR